MNVSMNVRTLHLCQRSGRTTSGLVSSWEDCFRFPHLDHPRTRHPEVEAISAEMRTFYQHKNAFLWRGNGREQKSLDEDKVDHPRLGASFNHFFLINHGDPTSGRNENEPASPLAGPFGGVYHVWNVHRYQVLCLLSPRCLRTRRFASTFVLQQSRFEHRLLFFHMYVHELSTALRD